MDAAERLAGRLPEDVAMSAGPAPEDAVEMRLRAGQRLVWTRMGGGSVERGERLTREALERCVDALAEHSLYAMEDQLARGYFTLKGGCRAGVCGRYVTGPGGGVCAREIGSVCVRIAREVKGAADGIMKWARKGKSFLILSAPGMGKTTMLRDAARQMSLMGERVAVADERGEIAACEMGVPALDVGPNTDVMDGCGKETAIPMLIRCMGARWVATDELGGEGDAAAVWEAARCGARVAATAHAGSLDEALGRRGVGELIRGGAFDVVFLLKGPGREAEAVYERETGG